MVACVWKDSALVFNLSTCYNVVPNERWDVVDRKVREKSGCWGKESLACPPSIIQFNKYMGGVDRHDHLRSSYTLQRSSSKWWLYFTWFAVDIALVNSYLIYKEMFPKMTHKKFQLQVCVHSVGHKLNDFIPLCKCYGSFMWRWITGLLIISCHSYCRLQNNWLADMQVANGNLSNQLLIFWIVLLLQCMK